MGKRNEMRDTARTMSEEERVRWGVENVEAFWANRKGNGCERKSS